VERGVADPGEQRGIDGKRYKTPGFLGLEVFLNAQRQRA